jgi:predicted glycosyl hydrolase (DUF1957 family)
VGRTRGRRRRGRELARPEAAARRRDRRAGTGEQHSRTSRNSRNGGTLRTRDPALDQLAREALLLLSSDWAFMISRDSAADYACQRVKQHAERFDRLADALEHRVGDAANVASELRRLDGPFGALDARTLGAS